MNCFSLKESQLVDFEHVAAGHDGVLSNISGDIIVKPCKQAEIDFYQTTSRTDASPADFAYYMPAFLGTLNLHNTSSEAVSLLNGSLPREAALSAPTEAVTAVAAAKEWVPSNGGKIDADSAIVMENLAGGLKKPNILDVKLGARLWADDAPTAKRQKLDKVAQETTSKSLGFRIAGMKIWIGRNNGPEPHSLNGYETYGKDYGRNLTSDTVHKGFQTYFFVGKYGIDEAMSKEVIRRFLEDLRGLQSVVEKQESRMYSASLLFVYEGDGAALKADFRKENILLREAQISSASRDGEADHGTDDNTIKRAIFENNSNESPEGKPDASEDDSETTAEELPKIQALKVIDFAHAAWTPGQGPDENFLYGIRNVIKILEDLLK